MTVEDCTTFLESLPLPSNFKQMAGALFRPLSQELVDEALKRLHNDVSPGDDSLGARVYKHFAEVFSPAMLEIAQHCFTDGTFFEDWGLGIINSIPKVAGSCVIAKLRPIALQAVKKKWLMTILCLQVEQNFQQLTHSRQVGCVKGRQMINHIWGVRSTFEMSERCLMVSFDFSNAFPTLSHTFIQAVLQLIELSIGYVLFVLATLRTPYQFCVGRGVVRDVSYVPKAGIGQGDPFSAVLFSFCVSFVLHLLSTIRGLNSYMYADDLCTIVEGANLVSTLARVQEAMRFFAKFSGQVLNLGKCGVVIKGRLTASEQAQVEVIRDKQILLGIPIVDSVKYLGVRMGNVTPDSAFAFPLGEAQRRAGSIASYGLSLKERILLLKMWILPCVLLTARAYFPTDITVRALKQVYHTALGVDSWGVTLDNLAQPRELGGFLLPTPKVWLHAQFGLPFHKLLQTPDVFTKKLVLGFYSWCKTYGVCLNAWALPYLQMGPVPYKTFGFMQFSFKSFSISRRYVIDGLGDHNMVGELPLWHSAIFQNDKQLTYYCPALIRQGVT